MICMAVDKQRLWYANPTGEQVPIYETDDDGKIIMDEVDGELFPRESGKWESRYTMPVKFYGNINAGDVGRSEYMPYGISVGDFEAKLVMHRGDVPINEHTLIWYQTTPKFKDSTGAEVDVIFTEDGIVIVTEDGEHLSTEDDAIYVDPKSADYKVKRVPPCLDEIDYLLSRNDNNGEEDS